MASVQSEIWSAICTLPVPASKDDVIAAAMISAYYQDCTYKQQQELSEWLSTESVVLMGRINSKKP